MRTMITTRDELDFRISDESYSIIRKFIIAFIKKRREVTLNELLQHAEENIAEDVGVNVSFYLIKVKCVLEAENVINVRRGLGKKLDQIISMNKQRTIL